MYPVARSNRRLLGRPDSEKQQNSLDLMSMDDLKDVSSQMPASFGNEDMSVENPGTVEAGLSLVGTHSPDPLLSSSSSSTFCLYFFIFYIFIIIFSLFPLDVVDVSRIPSQSVERIRHLFFLFQSF